MAGEMEKRGRRDLENYGAEYVRPGDNARYLRFSRAAFDLPPIDISDEKQVMDRINLYLDSCVENDMKPNLVGMANWLGVDRTTLASWKRGEYRNKTHSHIIQKAVKMLEDIMVGYMLDGKVNPAHAIFLLKNHMQYRDNTDITVTSSVGDTQVYSAEDIARRYLDDGRTVETTFSDTDS